MRCHPEVAAGRTASIFLSIPGPPHLSPPGRMLARAAGLDQAERTETAATHGGPAATRRSGSRAAPAAVAHRAGRASSRSRSGWRTDEPRLHCGRSTAEQLILGGFGDRAVPIAALPARSSADGSCSSDGRRVAALLPPSAPVVVSGQMMALMGTTAVMAAPERQWMRRRRQPLSESCRLVLPSMHRDVRVYASVRARLGSACGELHPPAREPTSSPTGPAAGTQRPDAHAEVLCVASWPPAAGAARGLVRGSLPALRGSAAPRPRSRDQESIDGSGHAAVAATAAVS